VRDLASRHGLALPDWQAHHAAWILDVEAEQSIPLI
jgi:hypothetical protein